MTAVVSVDTLLEQNKFPKNQKAMQDGAGFIMRGQRKTMPSDKRKKKYFPFHYSEKCE